MAAKYTHTRGTAIALSSNNPILQAGEIGIETDTVRLKVGNGVTPWNELLYAKGADLNLADLLDVAAGQSAPGDVLTYNGTTWVTAPAPIITGSGVDGTPQQLTMSGAANNDANDDQVNF